MMSRLHTRCQQHRSLSSRQLSRPANHQSCTHTSDAQKVQQCLLRKGCYQNASIEVNGWERAMASMLATLTIISSPLEALARDKTPYELAQSLSYGIVEQTQSIRACPSNINPNCVSTASTNDTYGSAWRANEKEPARAARALEEAVTDLYGTEGSRLLKSQTVPDVGEYRAFGIDSPFGQDIAEFLIKKEGVTNRNWEGDSEGALVTYRSMAGSVKYIWPIQQPLSDFGTQRKRLEAIRNQLGWQIIGCELIECYLQ